jgi:peptidoglycan/LPS O-acetylase OafA/YrhL
VLVSFAAAVLSWRFVEQPFRRRSAAPNGRVLLRYAAALLGCLMVARICYLAAGP